MHLSTFAAWVALRIFISAEEHCGYSFPWSPARLLPFQATPASHDFHHSMNMGCFASQFTWWDRICGTDKAWVAHLRKQAAAGAQPASFVTSDESMREPNDAAARKRK